MGLGFRIASAPRTRRRETGRLGYRPYGGGKDEVVSEFDDLIDEWDEDRRSRFYHED